MIVAESTSTSVKGLALPIGFSLQGAVTISVSLPAGFEETPLVRGTVESPDGSTTTAQSYGLPPTYDESIVVSVTTKTHATERLVFDPKTSFETLNDLRSVPVYSWHDSGTAQDGLAFELNATTVIWIYTRNVPPEVVLAIAAAIEVALPAE
ncbi:MAG: hypothetical protein HY826_06400 [Actinobacteria bacterium]|nr:hypothetical protein [Actinomycetota bacterium]